MNRRGENAAEAKHQLGDRMSLAYGALILSDFSFMRFTRSS